VLAEIEMESEDAAVELPDWVGEDVTGDPRYYNSALAGG
jgi:adenylate cyclase